MIHYNDIQKKYLITFSGPSVNNHIYIKYIYSAGFSLVKKYRFQIEKEYYQIYFKKIRNLLKEKILKINSSGRQNFEAIFTGHSIGASLATLAAFDMQQLKIVSNPKVFAFAPLRLGDATFVTLINSYVTVYRIVKKSDYLVRIPNCYFSPTYKVWRCFNEKIVREFILKPNFPLKIYLKSYLTYYTKTNIILQKAILFARKKFGLSGNRGGKASLIKDKSNKKNNRKIKNKNNKVLRIQKQKLAETLEKLNKQIKKSKKSKANLNSKKAHKNHKKIVKSIRKLKKAKMLSKNSKRSLSILLKKKNKNSFKLKKNDKKNKAKLLKNINKFLRKAENMSKKIKKQIEKIDKKLSYDKVKKKSSKKISSSKRKEKIKEEGKSKKNKKVSDEKKKDKKQKTNSPIKKVKSSSKKQMVPVTKYYTYIPSYKQIKVYTPIETYFTFLYYTQPVGYHILYNDSMTEYVTCQYKNGISQCEKIITIPNEFTVENHVTYFNVNFEKCN